MPIDMAKEYNSTGQSVKEFFRRSEEGFLVPSYQREYIWEEDNINQLFDDLVFGVRDLADQNLGEMMTFLGTVIVTEDRDKEKTADDNRAVPTAVQKVIDGQQRICTFSLIAIQLSVKISCLAKKIDREKYDAFYNLPTNYLESLKRIYTLQLDRGASPPFKPRIIREGKDKWTHGDDDTSYLTPVSHYIATFIRTEDPEQAFASIRGNGSRVKKNVKFIKEQIDNVCKAHLQGTDLYGRFPTGNKISNEEIQKCVFGFQSDNIKKIIETPNENNHIPIALYQLILLTYYFLNHCGINRLNPSKEEWGFDMFQALNATGTPLTVLETFLPQVMETEKRANNTWEKTPSYGYMETIHKFINAAETNEQKNQRTNELVRSFALIYNGTSLGNKFSEQRKWMVNNYREENSIDDKREFLNKLEAVALFYSNWWYRDTEIAPDPKFDTNRTDNVAQRTLFLVQYLKEASSRLSAPILARFYSDLIRTGGKTDDFDSAVEACAAFFTLWRAAKTTSGLDNVYRKFFSGNSKGQKANHWSVQVDPLAPKDLKLYFKNILRQEGLMSAQNWSAGAHLLLYTELKTICRFILFVASHDRVPDENRLGLTGPGINGACPTMSFAHWKGKNLKSLEHVAPQKPANLRDWDNAIYEDKDFVHQIGNLILLPSNLNTFADNKKWTVKYLYYSHVGESSIATLTELQKECRKQGINLKDREIRILSKMELNCTIKPLLLLGADGSWTAKLIEERTKQIKQIAWGMLNGWLS